MSKAKKLIKLIKTDEKVSLDNMDKARFKIIAQNLSAAMSKLDQINDNKLKTKLNDDYLYLQKVIHSS
jgi:hypothetical protein